jgi:hypothetical protein
MNTAIEHQSTHSNSDTSATLRQAYDNLYRNHRVKEDSPHKSRSDLAKRIGMWLVTEAPDSPIIVDLGSGPQAIERSLVSLASSAQSSKCLSVLKDRLKQTRILTIDQAVIPRRNMINRKLSGLQHVRAQFSQLPLSSESADLVVSNLALDMVRKEPAVYAKSLDEAARIMKPEGLLWANLHHSTLYEKLCIEFAHRKYDAQHRFYDSDPSAINPYYEYANPIITDFDAAGLGITSVRMASHYSETWWRVEAIKYETN